jgi:ParB-like chromosome segregation protein Spo0J
MKIHPIADKFPMLGDADMVKLADDIRENGLRIPIITWRGAVVDGRNRLRACEKAGVTPDFEEGDFASEHEVKAFIISMNIRRRHLTAGQLAMLGEELRPGLEAEARERERSGKGADGSGGRGNKKNPSTNSYEGLGKPARKQPGNVNAQIGLAVGVGAGTVAVAQKVKKERPELADKVIAGEMSLHAAYKKAVPKKEKVQSPLPPIDVKTLSGSAQEKLDAAIRQEKRGLQVEFQAAVQADLAEALNETVLPQYNKEKAEFRQVIEARKGIMTRATYRLILSCLHPDRVTDPEQKERYTEAFRAFKECFPDRSELRNISKEQMVPRGAEEWAKRRE